MALKPMSCPCHVQIFNKGLRSWRDLPLRYAEFGVCHRDEPSGALHGSMRTRGFEQTTRMCLAARRTYPVRSRASLPCCRKSTPNWVFRRPRYRCRRGRSRARVRTSVGLGGGCSGQSRAPMRPVIPAPTRRGRLLRPQTRVCAARSVGPILAMWNRSARQRSPDPSRCLICRIRRESRDPGDDPPRSVRLDRPFHCNAARAPCSSAAVLAVSRSSCRSSHIAGSIRIRDQGARRAGAESLRSVLFASAETLSRRIVAAHAASIPVVAVVGQREAEQGTVSLRERTGAVTVLPLADAVTALRQRARLGQVLD